MLVGGMALPIHVFGSIPCRHLRAIDPRNKAIIDSQLQVELVESVRIRNLKSETRVDGRLMLIHGIFKICLNQCRVILCQAFLQELLDFLITQCSLPKCDLVDGSLENDCPLHQRFHFRPLERESWTCQSGPHCDRWMLPAGHQHRE